MKRVVTTCALLSLLGCSFGATGTEKPVLPASVSFAPHNQHAIVSSHGSATFELRAVIDPSNGFPTLVDDGDYGYAPTLVVNPGDEIVGDISDDLPVGGGLASDVNLHFHGLGSSPMKPGDDVLTMLAKPGGALHYVVKVPPSQPPGLYWYHTHVHGETSYQVGQGGMSGAIVVQGLSAHVPMLAGLPEQILIVRELGTGAGSIRIPRTGAEMGDMEAMSTPAPKIANTDPCGPGPGGELLTIDRLDRPTLRVGRGRPTFFGIINATGHRTLDLSIDGSAMQIAAIDGYPVDTYPGEPHIIVRKHFVLPPAGRVEFVATVAASSELRTNCFYSGPIGDADPPQVLAHLRPNGAANIDAVATSCLVAGRARTMQDLPPPSASRTVRLGEDAKGFYINGKAFSPRDKPMFVVRTGTVERWTVLNLTSEVHAFHMHQVHFLVASIDGVPVAQRFWRDTVVVPYRKRQPDGTWKPGRLSLLVDFRSPIIRGTFLFHCHILDHEDHGMMAKIEAL